MSMKDDANALGYQHGLAGENKNPFIPADEWNHDGELHGAYEHGFSQGAENVRFMAEALTNNGVETVSQTFVPAVGTPVWCKTTLYDNNFDGWAIVTGVDQTGNIINVLTTYDGQPLQFTTDEFWEHRPPLEQVAVTLTDDDGKEFIVGYGEYADLDDNTKFNKLFYITADREEITIPLADVAPLLAAIKQVSRQ
jgi:hypothetical protein